MQCLGKEGNMINSTTYLFVNQVKKKSFFPFAKKKSSPSVFKSKELISHFKIVFFVLKEFVFMLKDFAENGRKNNLFV